MIAFIRRWSRVYLVCLAAGIPVWWALLHASGQFRERFSSDDAWRALQWFMPFDLVMASLLAVTAFRADRQVLLTTAVWGWLTMTLASTAWTVHYGSPSVGATLMAVALLGLICVRTVVVPSSPSSHQ